MRSMDRKLLYEAYTVTFAGPPKHDLVIEMDDIEVSDTVTVIWEIS